MLVQFGNNWIQTISLTAKLDLACGLVQFWLSSEFFSSSYFQIGQHVVLLHIQIENIYLFEKKNMETSVKTGFVQIALVAQKILSCPKFFLGGEGCSPPPPPPARTPLHMTLNIK